MLPPDELVPPIESVIVSCSEQMVDTDTPHCGGCKVGVRAHTPLYAVPLRRAAAVKEGGPGQGRRSAPAPWLHGHR